MWSINFSKLTHIDILENKHAMRPYIFSYDVRCKVGRKSMQKTRMRNIFALHMIPKDVKKGSGRRKTDYENRCKGNVGATPPVCIYSVIFFPKGLHEE